MSVSDADAPPPPPPLPQSQTRVVEQAPHTMSTIKLPILKNGEYDVWAMKMEHYLAHTDYPLWEVIQKSNGLVNIFTNTHGIMKVLPPKTAEETLARERERKARTTLLLALPEDHLAKFHKMTDAKEMWEAIKSRFGGNEESKKNKANDNSKRLGKKEESNALMTLDGGCVDWTSHSEDEQDNYAFMACNSSGSDTEVTSCSKECKESYVKLKKLYDEQREQLGDASIEIQAYTQALKKVEAQLVAHQQSQLWYEEKIRFMKIDLDDKTDVLTYHKKLLAEAEKVKEDLKAKVEKWHKSSKNLGKLQNTQMSANDKFGLGYGDFRYDGILSYENKVLQSVFMNKESDLENQPLYDRFVIAEGMHAIPLPMTGNYMPSGPDIEINYSQYTYGPKQSQPSESETQTSDFDTCESNISVETSEFVTETVINEPKFVSQPKVWSDAPIIEEYESDSEDEHVSLPTEEQETPSFANQQVKTPREIVKNQFTHSKIPKVDKKGLGYGFTTKACFVGGSLSHLIRDYDFHEKRMAKQVNTAEVNAVSAVEGKRETAIKPSASCNWRPKDITGTKSPNTMVDQDLEIDYPHRALQNKGIVDSGCFSHMTGNKAYLAQYQDFNGGPIAFGGSKGYITGKGKIKTRKLDFEDVCFVKELQHFNLFSVSQICDKKNKVLFTDSECLVLSPEFKLPDANQVLLRIPRQNNMYSFNLEKIIPSGGLAYLITKAIIDESNKWHRRLGHVNFKSLNKLVKGNLVKRDQEGIQYARTPQQNGVAKRKNMTLIEGARTMLADSFLPNTFWAEAVSTACFVLNRVLVTKPQNKTPYELVTGKIPIISYIRPFGCHVTILNTIDHQGKFDGKLDEGFLVGYSLQSKAFREYNLETKRVEENLHITFIENKPNVAGKGPTWLFDLDYLTDLMNYQPVRLENQDNKHASPQEANQNAVKSSKANNAGEEPTKHPDFHQVDKEDQVFLDELERLKRQEQDANDAAESLRKEFAQETDDLLLQVGAAKASSTNIVNTTSTPVSTASPYNGLSFTDLTNIDQGDSKKPALEEIYDNPTDGIFTNSSYNDEGAVADFTNLEPVVNVSPIPTSRINSIHPSTLILRDPQSVVQTRSKVTKSYRAHAFVSYIQKQRRNNHKDFQHCLFACFLSQNEPNKISEALKDESWVDAMQEELLQFKIQKVWILVDLPYGDKAIGTKWVYRNKKDERGVVVRNKARIDASMIFLAFASYMEIHESIR
ncbi:ribonuclease H-like domain-containing protein [Tanacetum coccineum]